MFGCERCKAHLERFSRVRSAGLATALSKIIPFDRRSVVHETFPPVGHSSSGVEQRTHKPLVGGSNPSSGTNYPDACVGLGRGFKSILRRRFLKGLSIHFSRRRSGRLLHWLIENGQLIILTATVDRN